jgi:cell division cycle protein 37
LSSFQQLEEQLKKPDLEEKERIKLELERDEIQKQEAEFRRKEQELADKERLQPWNVDTIGKEAWSKSIINKPKEKEQKKPVAKVDEEEEHRRCLNYYRDNDKLLKKLALLEGFDRMEEHMLEHPHLASEFATNWLTIEALNYAIEENVSWHIGGRGSENWHHFQETKMGRAAENCITIQFLLELAKSLNALATNTNVIKNFFKKWAKRF